MPPPINLAAATKLNTPLFGIKDITVQAKVIDVHDGDSITAAFATLGLGIFAHKIRLAGIDAPELDISTEKKYGEWSRDRLSGLVLGQLITLAIHRPDKYGRLLADITIGTSNINAQLLAEGYARPYNGGARLPWTSAELSRMGEVSMMDGSQAHRPSIYTP